MSDDAQRWKEKYLQNLEQQERLEQLWETRLDLLRRSVVRTSLAVEGADPAVESCMRELRELLRDGDIDQGLSALVPRLEKAVLDTERSRQSRAVAMADGLHRLVDQLLVLPLPSEIRKRLKQFGKQLKGRVTQTQGLPMLLGELSVLQDQALTAHFPVSANSGGFLGRLFNRKEPVTDGLHAQAATEQALIGTAEMAAAEPTQQNESVARHHENIDWALLLDRLPMPAEMLVPAEPELGESQDYPGNDASNQRPTDPDYGLPAMPEPAYGAVAQYVEATLTGLLDELALPEHHQPQASALHERIRQGLNWYELAPVLDDLAVLVLAMAAQGQREFESYLQSLNERLAAMQENLCAAQEDHVHTRESAHALDRELREQVGGLQDSVLGAKDLPSLKQAVQSRLDGLLETVDSYQKRRNAHEQQLSERLQLLVGRVATLEQAASGLRQHLEEQRQKALLDALTELPNRAAWDERLEMETARWQRYGGNLLLAVLDVDHFKRINDDFGHLAGDRVLKIIAGELRKRLRKTDFIARFGGEEFALLLPQTAEDAGLELLENLRSSVASCPFHFKGARIEVTLSAGLSAFGPGDSSESVFERADRALYQAKENGRNGVELG